MSGIPKPHSPASGEEATPPASAPEPAPAPAPAGILALDTEQMRELGYWVVDQVIDRLTNLGDHPAVREAAPQVLREQLGGPLPQQGRDVKQELLTLLEVATGHQQNPDHPRYFARVPGPAAFPSMLADWLVTGAQSMSSSWGGCAGPTTVELVVCQWLEEALGLGDGTQWPGVLTSGGSMANTLALLAARTHLTVAHGADRAPVAPVSDDVQPSDADLVVYLSDQTHSSLYRSLITTGFSPERIRVLPTGKDLRLSAATLNDAVTSDLDAGLRPGIVIATAGTTNTGAVDDLPGIADVVAAQGMWLHVDGAYGLAAALCERGRATLAGLERADSVVVDPHKWLFQSYDVGCVLVRHPGALEATFAMSPEYLRDVLGEEVSLFNRTLELTRRSRSFKLWLTLRSYGAPTLAAAVERGIWLAEQAQSYVQAHPRLEIITPAQLGVVNFALTGADDATHSRATAVVTESGFAALTTTRLFDRDVWRLCTINPATTVEDIHATIDELVAAVNR